MVTRLFSLIAAAYPAVTPTPQRLITLWIMMLPMEMKLCCKMLGTAMAAMLPNSLPEKMGIFPATGMPARRRATAVTAKTQLTL